MTAKKSAGSSNHDDITDGRIVSSRHLVSERCAELSELEYALIMTSNAFNKWMVRCMTAAGEPDMGAFDVSLLHHVNHRDRKKAGRHLFCPERGRYPCGDVCTEEAGQGGLRDE